MTPADEQHIRQIVRQENRTMMAAALADPGVNPTAKSLAGYLLDYLSRDTEHLNENTAKYGHPRTNLE